MKLYPWSQTTRKHAFFLVLSSHSQPLSFPATARPRPRIMLQVFSRYTAADQSRKKHSFTFSPGQPEPALSTLLTVEFCRQFTKIRLNLELNYKFELAWWQKPGGEGQSGMNQISCQYRSDLPKPLDYSFSCSFNMLSSWIAFFELLIIPCRIRGTFSAGANIWMPHDSVFESTKKRRVLPQKFI